MGGCLILPESKVDKGEEEEEVRADKRAEKRATGEDWMDRKTTEAEDTEEEEEEEHGQEGEEEVDVKGEGEVGSKKVLRSVYHY